MNEELLKFVIWITGHDEETVKQMYNDYSSSPQAKSIPVETPVSPTEPTFTQKQILDLVRKELTEAFSDDYTPDELKDKIYTVHGYIIGAIRRGEVRR